MEYLNGNGGYREIGKQFFIDRSNIRWWMNTYQFKWTQGLMRSTIRRKKLSNSISKCLFKIIKEFVGTQKAYLFFK
jgi:hypothetical protein